TKAISPAFSETVLYDGKREKDIQQPEDPRVTHTWKDCLQRQDVSAANALIHQGLTPDSYSTFEQALHLLTSAEESQRDLCKLVCDDIKQQYGKAGKLYAVLDHESQKPLLVAIPLSDTKEIMGYPLLSKDMSAIGDENRKVREEEAQR
ncbi:hypothetical protein MAR_004853, partial [Mya arenaria]